MAGGENHSHRNDTALPHFLYAVQTASGISVQYRPACSQTASGISVQYHPACSQTASASPYNTVLTVLSRIRLSAPVSMIKMDTVFQQRFSLYTLTAKSNAGD